MGKRVPIDELKSREYWSPRQTARILGRGPEFWVSAFDTGDVDGYTQTAANGTARYIKADSARAYLDRLSVARRARIVRRQNVGGREAFRELLAKRLAERAGQGA